ncbi:metallophosphoesterase 1 isoform X2 [Tachyglossus aculeatus]|uniref:metallophosphoesterase 1 isoform X2 n=1 Tax=Tachyglossus aculeatus TaxID=9261 RepID=UPI0018F662E7|nr:metallophosphoesterase 1 isoform X2 [Tachyglossus aculeatus]
MALGGWGLSRLRCLRLRRRSCFLLMLISLTFATLIFCEFLVYFFVIFQCSWPEVKPANSSRNNQTPEAVLKVMFLSDTHLLGELRGHWLDKLRREWQMERAFQTALRLLQPELVFILGDVFDEGKWSSPQPFCSQAWAADVKRFQHMFRHSDHTELMALVGNHDVGFHYEMDSYKLKRFEKVFNFTSGKLISRKGVNFVLVNSIALEGDGCRICSKTEAQLIDISSQLNCSRQEQSRSSWSQGCSGSRTQLPASAPLLLQHYPLYRRSDAECSGEDSAPLEEKNIPFKERYDVLSQEASQKLLWWFQPRLILSGHTHSACEVLHNGKIPEISIPSFSWRNRNNPSFILGSVTAQDYSLSKCLLPQEKRVLTVYGAAGVTLLLLLLAHFRLLAPSRHFAQYVIGKRKAT